MVVQQMNQKLEDRIRELEGRIDKLHMNRRLLLDIIEVMGQESQARLTDLEIKNSRLQKDNCRYARTIMARNTRILELEDQIKEHK